MVARIEGKRIGGRQEKMKKRLLVIGGVAAGPKVAAKARGYDPEMEIAVHCESGLRSYKACLKLQHEGFENVKNIDGGMLCWRYDLESKNESK
jgi:rhodanese-related sulfurtransferase